MGMTAVKSETTFTQYSVDAQASTSAAPSARTLLYPCGTNFIFARFFRINVVRAHDGRHASWTIASVYKMTFFTISDLVFLTAALVGSNGK
ncbi:uncharacterized protein LAESUDRAFT_558160 [Laetiporus sulphureus 93-53]|uniref:Uncharacterized protein n=1 Tax=Laetiporus sulphureus 93-53 TaxID=1314785 RepID=A0A165B6G0_9APHY|nr:uncharacterized protein LAESUDRAFT_558160 [Laetiporus sulphureus 93-53]KZT00349.1 hypothetical protein LAESUDRAFT_558160 [Laetiporus sulphureus 93-53]